MRFIPHNSSLRPFKGISKGGENHPATDIQEKGGYADSCSGQNSKLEIPEARDVHRGCPESLSRAAAVPACPWSCTSPLRRFSALHGLLRKARWRANLPCNKNAGATICPHGRCPNRTIFAAHSKVK